MTLTDFLLARIAEDERAARDAVRATMRGEISRSDFPAHVQHFISTATPARVLAECEAKRRIAERCGRVGALMPSEHLAQGVLSLLASPYADHDDYREEWRP
jgi:hypothetical protein